MRFPTRMELLLVALIAAVVNVPFALLRYDWSIWAASFCFGSALAQIALWIHARHQHPKEAKPSSPSQQPTSGTSPNPSPSGFLTGGLLWGPSPSPSPSPSEKSSESRFQPEPRAVPVVGFRSWNIDPQHRVGIGPGWRLLSYNRQYGRWEPGQNTAVCQEYVVRVRYSLASSQPKFHPAPDADCTCGFYVLTDFDKVPFTTENVLMGPHGELLGREPKTMMVGAVVGWGRVVQHGDEGWRAEKVQLIALLDCKVSDEHLRITHEVAESYGVPVVGRAALELLAKEYGDRLTLPEPALSVGKEA